MPGFDAPGGIHYQYSRPVAHGAQPALYPFYQLEILGKSRIPIKIDHGLQAVVDDPVAGIPAAKNTRFVHPEGPSVVGIDQSGGEVPFPQRDRPGCRPSHSKTSPFYETLKKKDAVYQDVYGWERPYWYAAKGIAQEPVHAF